MAVESSLKQVEQNGVLLIGFKDTSILEMVTIQRIGRELTELLDAGRRGPIVLDFRDVRFLSSQALGVLVTFRKKAAQQGCPLGLATIRPELMRVFKITSLDKLFTIFDTSDAAIAKLGTG